MSEMVERVARAIAVALHEEMHAGSPGMLAAARAAIEAMRKPTEAEFEVYADDELVASASGPRVDAFAEASRYAFQNGPGRVRVVEVIRLPTLAVVGGNTLLRPRPTPEGERK